MRNWIIRLSLCGGALGACHAAVFAAPPAAPPLKVVTTTADLAALAREVGGDRITVTALANPTQDPHQVDPKPSFIMQVNKADLLIAVGRELEIGWLPSLTTSARNAKVQPGGAAYLDASAHVKILEIPTGQITRAMGDVHPQGNPHYWLDPANGRIMARSIKDKLSAMVPADKPYFEQRYAQFDTRLAAAEKKWDAMLAPYKGAKLVTYHRSWPNFMERWGLNVMGYVEPKPGIPASPSHTIQLMEEMKRQNVKLIVMESYFSPKTAQSIASRVGGTVLVLAPSVGAVKEAGDYIQLFDYNIGKLAGALKVATGR
jgi:zinc/manganese transport system substrate-binding protein